MKSQIEDWINKGWRPLLFLPLAGAVLVVSGSEGMRLALVAHAQEQTAPPPATVPQGNCNTVIGRDNNGTVSPDCRTYINPLPPRQPYDVYQLGKAIGRIRGYGLLQDKVNIDLFDLRTTDFMDDDAPLEIGRFKVYCPEQKSRLFSGRKAQVNTFLGTIHCRVVQ